MPLSIVIVNWNTGPLLGRCLASLAHLPEKEVIDEVVVVDNASRDRSVARAKQAVSEADNKPRVRFIQLDRNVGFARANNIALERIKKRLNAYGHVLLLNPDTEVRPGSLTALLSVFKRREQAGVVGPKLLNPDGSWQPSVRSFPTAAVLAFMFLKLHRLMPRATWWRHYMQTDFDYGREQSVDQVMGAAFLMRNTLLETVGVLDEGFWIWFEEVDLCQRARSAGFEVVYTPQAEVLHYGGVSFDQLIGWRRSRPWIASSLHYAAKHFGAVQTTVLWLLAPLAVVLMIPASFVHLVSRRQHKQTVS